MLNAGMFRRHNLVAVAIAALAAFAAVAVYSSFAEAGPGKGNGKGKAALKTKHVSCDLTLTAILPPRTLTAENFGTIACNKVFGEGVQHDSSVVTPTGQYMGHFTGPVKQFFDKGTISGTFTISYVTDPTTLAVSYDGTIDITKGTGRYQHVKGAGTLKGASPDAIHSTIHEELTLTKKKKK
jgi:hypothetical protein